jgi:Tetratricopeptide repeat
VLFRAAVVISQLGRFDEAIGHAETAVRIAEAADHPYTLYFGLFDLGRAHLRRGDLPRATRVLERGLDLCRAWQIVSRYRSSPRPSASPTPSPAVLTRRSRWSLAPSRSSAVARITSGRRSFFSARGRPTSGRANR